MTTTTTTPSPSPLRKALRWLLACAALLALGAPQAARAQTDAALTQYYQVPSYYNAGAIGVGDMIRIRLGSRLQWLGIHGAPRTFLGAADMPVKLLGKRIAVGLVVGQESIGLYRTLGLRLQGAYKIKLFKGVLSPGFSLGFVDQQFKGSEVFIPDGDDYHQATDEGLPQSDVRGNGLDLGLGLWYTHRLFWAGLSATHLNEPTISMDADSGSGGGGSSSSASRDATASGGVADTYEYRLKRTLYFMGGSNIQVKNTLFEVQPSLFVASDFTNTTWQASAGVRYNRFLSATVGYRWKDAVTLTLAAEVKNFYIGLSYDYSTSAISRASSGSVEVFAGYSLRLDMGEKNRHRHKSIRIM